MRLSEGEMLTLAGAFFFGIEFVNDAYLSVHTDLFFYTSTILIVLLGIIFLKERSHIKLKIIGAIVSLIGVVLVR